MSELSALTDGVTGDMTGGSFEAKSVVMAEVTPDGRSEGIGASDTVWSPFCEQSIRIFD